MKHARNAAPGLLGVVSNLLGALGTTGKVIAGALAAVVAATPFGAWGAAADEAIPLVVDEPTEMGPLEITVEKVVSTKALGDVEPMNDGDKLLVVVLDVENVSDLAVRATLLRDIVPAPAGAGVVDPGSALDGLDEATAAPTGGDAAPATGGTPVADDVPPAERPDADVYNIADSAALDHINPGMSYRMALVWNQAGSANPAEARIELAELHWVAEGESITGLSEETWLPLDQVTHGGTFPVEKLRPESGTEPGTEPGSEPGTEPGGRPGTDPGAEPGTQPSTEPGGGA